MSPINQWSYEGENGGDFFAGLPVKGGDFFAGLPQKAVPIYLPTYNPNHVYQITAHKSARCQANAWSGPCHRPSKYIIEGGCKHEHIYQATVCHTHYHQEVKSKPIFCGDCRNNTQHAAEENDLPTYENHECNMEIRLIGEWEC